MLDFGQALSWRKKICQRGPKSIAPDPGAWLRNEWRVAEGWILAPVVCDRRKRGQYVLMLLFLRRGESTSIEQTEEPAGTAAPPTLSTLLIQKAHFVATSETLNLVSRFSLSRVWWDGAGLKVVSARLGGVARGMSVVGAVTK